MTCSLPRVFKTMMSQIMVDQLGILHSPRPDKREKPDAETSIFERLAEAGDDYQDNPMSDIEDAEAEISLEKPEPQKSEKSRQPPQKPEEEGRPLLTPTPLEAMIIAPIALAQLTNERLHRWRIQRIQKKATRLNEETERFRDAAMELFKLPIGPELTRYQSALESDDRDAIAAGEEKLAEMVRETPEAAKKIAKLREQGAQIQIKAHRLIADSAFAARGVWFDTKSLDMAGNDQIMRLAKFIAERVTRLLNALRGAQPVSGQAVKVS